MYVVYLSGFLPHATAIPKCTFFLGAILYLHTSQNKFIDGVRIMYLPFSVSGRTSYLPVRVQYTCCMLFIY